MNGTHTNGVGLARAASVTVGVVERLAGWIREQAQKSGKRIDHWELRRREGKEDACVESWPMSDDVPAHELARRAFDAAELDAEGERGTQRYGFAWLTKGEGASHGARTTFAVMGQGGHALAAYDVPETAVSAGVHMHTLRHLEHREAVVSTEQREVFSDLRAIIEDQRGQIKTLLGMVGGYFEERERLIEAKGEIATKEHERALEAKRFDAGERRKDAALAMLVKMTPYAMHAFAQWAATRGAAAGAAGAVAEGVASASAPVPGDVAAASPGAPSDDAAGAAAAGQRHPFDAATVEAIVAFVTSLDEATFMRIAGVLSHEQLARFTALAEAIAKGGGGP